MLKVPSFYPFSPRGERARGGKKRLLATSIIGLNREERYFPRAQNPGGGRLLEEEEKAVPGTAGDRENRAGVMVANY